MAERNISTPAIILTVKNSGESDRSVRALSPERGIFYCTLYGGPKSRMRSLVQPFSTGRIWLYEDQAKKSCKITDFSVESCHISFRTSLYKMWAANLACELVIKTKCAGEYEKSYVLLKALMDGMDACDEDEARAGTLRFLWRYLGVMGLQPDTERCSQCGEPLAVRPEDSAFYSHENNGFTCADCATERSGGLRMDSEGLRYLGAVSSLSPARVRGISVSPQSAWLIKSTLYFLAEHAAGTKLKSLESGIGIL